MMVVRNVLITLPHLHTSNLDHKHGCTQDMASMVAPELNASHFFHFMEVDRLDLVHAFLQVRLCVQHVICRNITAEREAEDEDHQHSDVVSSHSAWDAQSVYLTLT